MVKLDLSTEDARVLAEILASVMSDMRMEIADTEKMEWRDELKRRKMLLERLITELETGS
ncbi:MAG: hypothetical protein ACOZCP_16160 [Pseudomonadota bacterium]